MVWRRNRGLRLSVIKIRFLTIFCVLLLLLVILSSCASPRSSRVPSIATKEPSQEGMMVIDRIAYIGADDDLYTIRKDGSDSRRLTGELKAGTGGVLQARELQGGVFYTWPTWSPDGSKIAVSRVIPGEDSLAVSLQVVDVTTGGLTHVYDNEPGASPLIAQGIPHYSYWSPDGSRLAFIASTAMGLTLFVSNPQGEEPPVPVVRGGPVYFHWSSDSRSLLLHVGEELMVAEEGLLQLPRALGLKGAGFQAPAWSRGSAEIVYSSQSSDGSALYLADTQKDGSSKAIAEVGNRVAFLWSPVGKELAVAETEEGSGPLYDRLTIVDAEASSKRTLVEESFLAFFWSPNGEKIAYAAVDPSTHIQSWKVVPVDGGTPKTLAQFEPSQELFTMFLFFDQYAYSSSVWSPDSTQLVFSGNLSRETGRRNGGSSDEDKVYVLSVDGDSTPKEIATGNLAFWSWN